MTENGPQPMNPDDLGPLIGHNKGKVQEQIVYTYDQEALTNVVSRVAKALEVELNDSPFRAVVSIFVQRSRDKILVPTVTFVAGAEDIVRADPERAQKLIKKTLRNALMSIFLSPKMVKVQYKREGEADVQE